MFHLIDLHLGHLEGTSSFLGVHSCAQILHFSLRPLLLPIPAEWVWSISYLFEQRTLCPPRCFTAACLIVGCIIPLKHLNIFQPLRIFERILSKHDHSEHKYGTDSSHNEGSGTMIKHIWHLFYFIFFRSKDGCRQLKE